MKQNAASWRRGLQDHGALQRIGSTPSRVVAWPLSLVVMLSLNKIVKMVIGLHVRLLVGKNCLSWCCYRVREVEASTRTMLSPLFKNVRLEQSRQALGGYNILLI